MKTPTQYIESNEGFSRHIYLDSEGIETIGIGFNLEHGFTLHECRMILMHRVCVLEERLAETLDCFDKLNDVRKLVLIDMAYNLGIDGLRRFKRMLHAMCEGDYDQAGLEIMDSKYATQVGARAKRNARMMKTGEYYGP